MKGFILKDLFCSYLYCKSSGIIVLIIFFLLGLFMSGPTSIAMIIYIIGIFGLYTFSYDEMAKWEVYALSLPIKRSEIIMTKYIFILICNSCGLMLGFLMGLIKRQMNLESITTILISFIYIIFVNCLILPLIFKFGATKARLLMLLTYILPAVIIFLLGQVLNFESLLTSTLFLPICGVALCVIFFLSYFCSCKIYQKKEF